MLIAKLNFYLKLLILHKGKERSRPCWFSHLPFSQGISLIGGGNGSGGGVLMVGTLLVQAHHLPPFF